MRVTVVELDGRPGHLEPGWEALTAHVLGEGSRLVVLPEMPFDAWLPASAEVDEGRWEESVEAHDSWIERLPELGGATVVASRPVTDGDHRYNEGFVWDPRHGYRAVHRKTFLPEEPGFWEMSWYDRAKVSFEPVETPTGVVGLLICTELWWPEHARAYGRAGVEMIVSPRATEAHHGPTWLVAGRTAAIVAGAFSLSSVHHGSYGAFHLGGGGWVVSPAGEVLAHTSPDRPYLTVEIRLGEAHAARSTYPRYVDDSWIEPYR